MAIEERPFDRRRDCVSISDGHDGRPQVDLEGAAVWEWFDDAGIKLGPDPNDCSSTSPKTRT